MVLPIHSSKVSRSLADLVRPDAHYGDNWLIQAVLPAHLVADGAGQGRDPVELLVGPLDRSAVEHQAPAVGELHEQVRDVPLAAQPAGPRQHERTAARLIPTTCGDRSKTIRWCRPNHDSYTTWPRVVADHHHPGRFRCPRNPGIRRAGADNSKATASGLGQWHRRSAPARWYMGQHNIRWHSPGAGSLLRDVA